MKKKDIKFDISISCPHCNNNNHKMTILVDKTTQDLFLKCNNCNTYFNLVRCELVEIPEKE